jgi:DNA-directed RNA polymerase specialized sigma24 family protein
MLVYWDQTMLEEEMDRQSCNEYLEKLNNNRADKRERRTAIIRERVANLPRPERLAVYLHFWENSSISEIARVLDITKELAAKLLNNGLTRLQTELQAVANGYKTHSQTKELIAA